MTICNSCRYCEGFCAVFPAMERRLQFSEADLNYLANLCHNCAECFYACQYAPPHEFAVNVPKVLAEIRVQSYRKYSWPGIIRSAWVVSALVIVFAALALVFTPRTPGGDFYAAIPHGVMVGFFGVLGLLVLAFWGIGLARFWNEDRSRPRLRFAAFLRRAQRRADAFQPIQPRRGMHLSGRAPFTGAPRVSSLHLLWLSAVLRLNHQWPPSMTISSAGKRLMPISACRWCWARWEGSDSLSGRWGCWR